MGTIKGKSRKKYRTREGEYKNLEFFCTYHAEEINDQSIAVKCFITSIHPHYTEDKVDNIKDDLNIEIDEDIIPTAVGDYRRIIDGFSFICPLKTNGIKEFEKRIENKVEEILFKLIGNDKVIESCYSTKFPY